MLKNYSLISKISDNFWNEAQIDIETINISIDNNILKTINYKK